MNRWSRIVCTILAFVFLLGLVGIVTSCNLTFETRFTEATAGKVFGNRIPKAYFVTSGQGDTDIGPGDDPWETGSYDLALMEAEIANFNVLKYTSVLPPEAKEIPISEAKESFHHGAVIETIMASRDQRKHSVYRRGKNTG